MAIRFSATTEKPITQHSPPYKSGGVLPTTLLEVKKATRKPFSEETQLRKKQPIYPDFSGQASLPEYPVVQIL